MIPEKNKTTALLIYASFTGTTLEIAEILQEELEHLGIQTELKECTQAYADEFLDYDICVVATYTYGSDGDIPEESEDFFYEMEEVDLTGKIFGVLGSGDLIYKKFCPAVDYFDEQFENSGATRGAEMVKINLQPDDEDKKHIKAFAKSLSDAFSSKQ